MILASAYCDRLLSLTSTIAALPRCSNESYTSAAVINERTWHARDGASSRRAGRARAQLYRTYGYIRDDGLGELPLARWRGTWMRTNVSSPHQFIVTTKGCPLRVRMSMGCGRRPVQLGTSVVEDLLAL